MKPHSAKTHTPDVTLQEREQLQSIGYAGLMRPHIAPKVLEGYKERGLTYEVVGGGHQLTDLGHHIVLYG